MPETVISKICSKCKQVKLLSEFYREKNRPDGHNYRCKECKKKVEANYRQTEKGKAAIAKYNRSEKHKAVKAKCQVKFPEKSKARDTVSNAVKAGKLPKPTTLKCKCGNQAEQYHHHKGYESKHQLNVIAVCKSCHINFH